jgi:hypothetical protein
VTRVAAVLAWISGLGFGLPAVFGLRYFAQHHEVWTFMGFPTYGGGPFESWGIESSTTLLAGFTAVCAVEVVLGVLLWVSPQPIVMWLALILFPFELFFWIGFALPIGPVLGTLRTVLVIHCPDRPVVIRKQPRNDVHVITTPSGCTIGGDANAVVHQRRHRG